jgi:hypothetical protein
MEWKFKELTDSDTKVDPSHLEFFRSEALEDAVSALIREDIQNRLDANKGKPSPLQVHYNLSGKETALDVNRAQRWLAGLEPHLNAPKTLEELGVDCPFLLNQPMPYLVIEGFNESGLKGDPCETKDPVEKAERNDFYWFIRNVGRTGKKAGDRGRWGLGKIVYPASSSIRSFYCYSVRAGDFRQALIGRSVLAIHAINGPEYVSEGYFAKFEDRNPNFAIPEESSHEIVQFIKDFNIQRTPSQPGISLVIPFPEGSITVGSLVQGVIKSYFWEILRGTLEVVVTCGVNRTVIKQDSINDVVMSWEGLDDKDKKATQRRMEFCRKADRMKMGSDCYFELSVPKSYGSPRLQEQFISEDAYQKACACFREGNIVALELGISVTKSKTNQPKTGSFLVYLQKDDELDGADETFIRDGLTIIGERYIREAGVRALVLAEHEPINEFLGDAENPAHTKWLPTTKHFHGKYSPGKALLEYIQHAAARLSSSLGKVENELLEDLLADIFGIPTENDSKAQDKDPSKKRGRKKPKGIIPKPRAKYLEVSRLKNGFRVIPASDATGTPNRVIIKMAYEAEDVGNPFTLYHPADFNLADEAGSLITELVGCKEIRRAPNMIEVEVDDKQFSIGVSGFDPNRDLNVDVTPTVDKKNAEEAE